VANGYVLEGQVRGRSWEGKAVYVRLAGYAQADLEVICTRGQRKCLFDDIKC
jgi:hypothetical protein